MLIAALFYCAQPALAGVVKLSGADFLAATQHIENFLAQSESVEELRNSLSALEDERLLDLVFSEALRHENRTQVAELLQVDVQPPAGFQASKDLKEKAVRLLKMFEDSPATRKALAKRIHDFDLWSFELLPFIQEQSQTLAGLTYAYPGLEKIAARLTQKQAEDLAEAIHRIPEDSPLKRAALFRIDIFSSDDLRAMLKYGAEVYAGSVKGDDAFVGALYSLVNYVRLNKEGSLAIYEEEKRMAVETLSVFNKRTQFYQGFLRQGFEISPRQAHLDCQTGLGSAIPTDEK